MRTSLQWFLPVFLAAFSACTNLVQAELDETHARLEALQKEAGSVNRELTSLNQILVELDTDHTVNAVSPVEGIGYDLSFKDGKVVRITFGKDGTDGRVLPLGVKEEEGVYYWTVDGEFLLDAAGNKVRAGARQGVDGIVPQFKVEDGSWWVSMDGGVTFEPVASCAEMEGFTVFRTVDALSDPEKVLLTLQDGSSLELPRYVPVYLSFGEPQRNLLIAPGEERPVEYLLRGSEVADVVITTGTDGNLTSSLLPEVEVNADGTERRGRVVVTAPQDFTEGYILLNAFSNGYSTVQMLCFTRREFVLPDGDSFAFTSQGGERKVPYTATFPFRIEVDYAARSWLRASLGSDGTIVLTVSAHYGGTAREGQVRIIAEDNVDYVCATLTVCQASPFDE